MMATYILIGLIGLGVGGICGIAAAFVFGMMVSQRETPRQVIDPVILAEVISERLGRQVVDSKESEKVRT
jgi:F0F1-type ATP synthase membrane subunit c/vacuolar-type H+-ATPase subunit K